MRDHKKVALLLICILFLSGCYKPGPGASPWKAPGLSASGAIIPAESPTSTIYVDELQITQNPLPTLTPNPTVVLPTPRTETLTYIVQPGDTIRKIGMFYQVSVEQIVTINQLSNPNLIEVGQSLLIPPPSFEATASSFKIIPDSELINSPSNANFDTLSFVNEKGGYLAYYSEPVNNITLSGAQIINRVALEYSVNPRLLLALLEYQSSWVTEIDPPEETLKFPIGYFDPWREGLYSQLGWAANLLNEGYYLWKINGITAWILSDSSVIKVDPTINPGTAGVLNLMRHLKERVEWNTAISPEGLYATYLNFFGYPFLFTFEPMIPEELTQPLLQLPFEKGVVWSYTGGPHGGWNSGSAWAAIDFAPTGEALGCVDSDAWVVASAPGEIVYSDHGAVIQDLDGDGIWQTGWSILYMHIATVNRVEVGDILDAGDRIGHPSCEGGFSTGTHLHIARRYNGEWIAADAALPFDLDGWLSGGYGIEYDGYLMKGEQILEAWNGRSSLNAIQR